MKLALALGFLEYDIEAYKVRNKYNEAATVSILSFIFIKKKLTIFEKKIFRSMNYLKYGVIKNLQWLQRLD